MTNKVPTFGSRIQVYRGHAKKTSGGLTKTDLMMNKHGRVVSKAKHNTAKKEMRLLKHGYGTQKGKFGFVKIGSKSRKSKSRKMKGGMYALSPAQAHFEGDKLSGDGITDFGAGTNDVQFRAGMSGGSGMAPLSSPGAADWAGEDMSGGRGRSRSIGRAQAQALSLGRSKSRTRGMARSVGMRGGTGHRGSAMFGSDAVQLRAGEGN